MRIAPAGNEVHDIEHDGFFALSVVAAETGLSASVQVSRRRVVYVNSSPTARTRCAMRNLRRRRYWWRADTCGRFGHGLSCKTVEVLDKFGFYVAFGYLLQGAELETSPRGSP